MKKFISIFMIVVMLSAIMAVNTSAAGSILFYDGFDGSEINPISWCTDVAAFYAENGWCKGDSGAVALQSRFDPLTEGGPRMRWSEGSFAVDVAFFDYDSDGESAGASLWWRDYVRLPGEEEYEMDDLDNGSVYMLTIDIISRELSLSRDATSTVVLPEGEELTDDLIAEHNTTVATYELPEDYEITVDVDNPTILNLGMRVSGNTINCYLDGKLVMSYTAPNQLGTGKPSPVILFNSGMIIGFDNFTVATVDYELFEDDKNPAPAPTPEVSTDANGGADQNGGNNNEPKETEIKEVIVTDTDDSGNVVTKVDTEIVTVAPPADTNTGGTAGGTGAQTGDMAVIVIAVMVVTLGTAIVVKKVNVK